MQFDINVDNTIKSISFDINLKRQKCKSMFQLRFLLLHFSIAAQKSLKQSYICMSSHAMFVAMVKSNSFLF